MRWLCSIACTFSWLLNRVGKAAIFKNVEFSLSANSFKRAIQILHLHFITKYLPAKIIEKFVKFFIYSVVCIGVVFISINPSAWAGYDTMSVFKWSLTGFNSEFSFSSTSCLTKAEELSLPYYFHIAGFIPFPRVLVLCEWGALV